MLPLLFILSYLGSSFQTEWAWSIHPESGFKILVPFHLTEKVTEIPAANGQAITYHQFHGGSIHPPTASLVLVIDHYKMPASEYQIDDEYLQEFFEVTIYDLLENLGGELTYMDRSAYSDMYVCTWKGSYEHGSNLVKGKLILSKGSYYGLQAFTTADHLDDVVLNKFFDSFQLIPDGSRD